MSESVRDKRIVKKQSSVNLNSVRVNAVALPELLVLLNGIVDFVWILEWYCLFDADVNGAFFV